MIAVALLRAELALLVRRAAGLAVPVVGLVAGLGVPLAYLWATGQAGITVNGAPLASQVTATGFSCGAMALEARHFFLMPLVLVLAAATSIAGDLRDHTLREDLVRPVPRGLVLVCKVAALWIVAMSSLVLGLVASVGLGTALFGPGEGDFARLVTGWAVSTFADLAILAATALVAVLVRETGLVLVLTIFGLMFDMALRGAAGLVAMMTGAGESTFSKVLFGGASALWGGWDGTFDPIRAAALVVWIGGCLALAVGRFARMDVP